jgi:argininosuccinate synthase
MKRIVLGYSGSLKGSVAIHWLIERLGADVVTVTLDIGQEAELADVRERALNAGAVRAHVLDARDEFARGFVLPALQAGAASEDGAPPLTGLGRPLIARKLIDIARMEGAIAVAHCCRPFSNDEARVESALRALNPDLTIVAPLRESRMTAEELIAYARERNVFVPTTADVESADVNLWGRSASLTADRSTALTAGYVLTRTPEQCAKEAASLEIEFDHGVPVRANGIEMPLAEMIESLETIAGSHGVGRFDGACIHEAPAAVVLQTAHRELEHAAHAPELSAAKTALCHEYARLVDEGRWFTPMREAIDAFVASVQQRVNGVVRIELLRGDCRAVSSRVYATAPPNRVRLETHTQADLEPAERFRGL